MTGLVDLPHTNQKISVEYRPGYFRFLTTCLVYTIHLFVRAGAQLIAK